MPHTELTVRGESVQSLYSQYLSNRFQVNRRYQRKLVWTVEEKRRFVDSMRLNLPVPLFLVAEAGGGSSGQLEVIDGMQRLNAIFSFIENDFSLQGGFFDLDSLADTKVRLDRGELKQMYPKLDRQICVDISNYPLPLSVFRAEGSDSVDEAFRRINSGGKRLSFQELRQAGTLSDLADLVRRIASRIRGDYTSGDMVALQKMPELSISNRDLDYGVNADEMFWVANGILRREDLRVSLDEELVLDLILDCLYDELRASHRQGRDASYDYLVNEGEGYGHEVTKRLLQYGVENFEEDFFRAFDVIQSNIQERFATHIGVKSGGRAPRYWLAIFVAVFEILNRDPRMGLVDGNGFAQALKDITKRTLAIPGGSGRWTAEDKRARINAVIGVLSPFFQEETSRQGLNYGFSRMQSILDAAIIEHAAFECKQGVLNLDDNRLTNEKVFRKLAETSTALANQGPGAEGYFAIGVADNRVDAERVRSVYGTEFTERRGEFFVVGVEREAGQLELDLQDYCEFVINKISSVSGLPEIIRSQIRSNYFLVDYHDHFVLVVRVRASAQPQPMGSAYFVRDGSSTVALPAERFGELFERFASGGN